MIESDINNIESLKNIILLLKPDIIIHLAAISNAYYAMENPIETFYTNGIITAHICDILYKNKLSFCKLFNASSSEIYKGHTKYFVNENDTHMYHLHPYAIAKIMAHNTIKMYRENHLMLFSNGIIFTTESSKKSDKFLMNKIAKHIKSYKEDSIPLCLGDLNSYRNILHASDVAGAIYTIVKNNADDYIICNLKNHKIQDIVEKMYTMAGFDISVIDNKIINNVTNKTIVQLSSEKLDGDIIDIDGYPTKLLSLGWTPKMNIDEIIKEIIDN